MLKESILQYFRPLLSYHLSGRLRQVLLYMIYHNMTLYFKAVFCAVSLFCDVILNVLSNSAIILLRKGDSVLDLITYM